MLTRRWRSTLIEAVTGQRRLRWREDEVIAYVMMYDIADVRY